MYAERGRHFMTVRQASTFATDLVALEEVEKSITRLVATSIDLIKDVAAAEFASIQLGTGDTANYLGEDLTRMALDQVGMSRVPGARLFGAVDYKSASFLFLPTFGVKIALLVDSKAEKGSYNDCRVQVTQTSREIRQLRSGAPVAVQGMVPPWWGNNGDEYLTSTFFVKYHYKSAAASAAATSTAAGTPVGGPTSPGPTPLLKQISVVALPHGFLQNKYNPSAAANIWNAGPNAPARGESFRTRANFTKLRDVQPWRVQVIKPGVPFTFDG